MKKVLVFFVVFIGLFSINVIGQESSVQWSELERVNGNVISILPGKGKDFYSLRWTGGNLLGAYKLVKHVNCKSVISGKIMLKALNGMANFEDVRVVGNKLIVFLSDRFEGENRFYMQEYDESLEPLGNAKQLVSYELEKGRDRGFFQVITSRDNQFLGVIYEIPGRKGERDRYGFKIFDNQMNEISDGDYKLPYNAELSRIDQHYLSNTGDYFISVTEFSQPEERKVFRTPLNYKAMHILHITDEGLDDFVVNMAGRRVEAMTMNSDNQRVFTLTGIYGDEGSVGVSGLFYLRVDFDKQQVIDEGFEKFGKDFITQDWSEREKEKAEKKEQKGRGEPQLYNYVMRQTEVLVDGSLIGSLEQYYVVVSTYTDPRTGATRTTYTYYYNDIVAFKIRPEGGFEWLKKINKYQVSTNDGGPYSSYARYVNNGKLCFIFNDSDRNFDELGNYTGDNRTFPANFGRRRNVVSLVEVDLKSGDVSRKTLFEKGEYNAVVIPKMFFVDYQTNELILYALYGRTEKFGAISLKQ